MTPRPSRIPVAKAALVALLQARPALGSIVTYGVPRQSPAKEWVVVGNVEGDQRAVTVGRGGSSRRGESFRILVVVIVNGTMLDDQQAMTERAYELVAEIEDALRDDAGMGLPVADGVYVAEVVKTDLDENTPDGQARQSVVTVYVQCTTRI